jgi:hypothetical protein
MGRLSIASTSRLLLPFIHVQVRVKFEQIFMSKPLVTEPDGEMVTLFPKEARLRNLT